MQPNRRLLARVVAPLVLLLASCSTPPGTVHRAAAPQPIALVTPAPPAPPPTPRPSRPSLTVQLRQAVELDAEARWYVWAASLPPTPRPHVSKRPAVHQAPDPGTAAASGDRFDRLASCESGQNPRAVSPTGKYRGAFQFSIPSWHGAGMTGDPVDFSYSDQKAAAERWAGMTNPSGQWPVCWPRSA